MAWMTDSLASTWPAGWLYTAHPPTRSSTNRKRLSFSMTAATVNSGLINGLRSLDRGRQFSKRQFDVANGALGGYHAAHIPKHGDHGAICNAVSGTGFPGHRYAGRPDRKRTSGGGYLGRSQRCARL